MNHKIITVFTVIMLLSKNVLANESKGTPYEIIFSDNTELTGGPNDLGPTGDLEFIYTHPDNHYKISIKGEVFVNGDPKDQTPTRTDPDNMRIDTLNINYIQGKEFKYGAGIEILGNLRGKSIQNMLHNITPDPHIPANYTGITKSTPTLNFEYKTNIFNYNIHFYSTGKVPLFIDNGVLELDAMINYTSKDIYDLNFYASIGVGVECTRYPDLPEFKGYPIGDFQVCTPETKLALMYNHFTLFLEIPLMNNDVQNSVLGLAYQF